MEKPRIVVFASGTKYGGGSGFENLVLAARNCVLRADIAVVSNHECGGVRERADRLKIPFVYFPAPWTADRYQAITRRLGFDFVACSGWVKKVLGLDPKITFNIHPGPLPDFGGLGMYGHYVHESVLAAYLAGRITHSAVSMHFVTEEEYDKGPVFFHFPVEIGDTDTADDIGRKVNASEHRWQPVITDMVVHGEISWDGKNPNSLHVPEKYPFLPQKG